MSFRLSCGLLWVFLFMLLAELAYAQGGTIKGRVIADGEPAAEATVMVLRGGALVQGRNTDLEGNFIIPDLPPADDYVVQISYLGNQKKIEGVKVSAGLTTPLGDIVISSIVTEVITVTAKENLVKADESIKKSEFGLKDLRTAGSRGIGALASQTAGVFQQDENRGLNIGGARGDATQTFIDGIRVIGSATLPQSAIANISVITRGVPPWYGDLTSGVIEITTAEPSSEHHAGVEILSSQLTDPYGYNLGAINFSGPLISKKDSINNTKITKVGYFLAVEGSTIKDPSPSAFGVYRLKPEVRKDLEETPLQVGPDGRTFINRGQFIRGDKIENIKAREDARHRNLTFNGRLDFKLGKTAMLKVGGSGNFFNGQIWDLANSLFAPAGNENRVNTDARGWARFSQVIFPDSIDKSILKSLSYWLQFDYTYSGQRRQVREFGDDIFSYGYVGKFITKRAPVYRLMTPGTPGFDSTLTSNFYWETAGYVDTAYIYVPGSTKNPILANYNRVIAEYYRNNPRYLIEANIPIFEFTPRTSIFSRSDLYRLGGLVNGLPGNPNTSIYSLWDAQGTNWGSFGRFRSEMFRVTGQASMILGRKAQVGGKGERGTHTLKFGFEFDQRIIRGYSLAASGLWILMNNLMNQHLGRLDRNKPQVVTVNGVFQDTVKYNYAFSPDYTQFDSVVRRKLFGTWNEEIATRWVNIDELDPSFFSLDMFTARELLNEGKPYVSYYGYDHTGKVRGRVAPETFFTDTRNRPQNAFAPTYVAAYIQDKFELDNLYLTLGLRVDRLDLNQKVLRDPYVMAPFYTAGEAAERLRINLPSNIGRDWVPYVDNPFSTAPKIVGYRNKDVWYDEFGAPTSPQILANRIQRESPIPFLRDTALTIDAFKDYVPQWNYMPRVSFSFPITDRANFFAHYDVLVQRPTGQEIGRFTDYLYIRQNSTVPIANPALTPQQTIDYEVGFQQNLDEDGNAAIVISAFYREMRNMIQIVRIQEAYPTRYDTYRNLDFGTVKGFTFEFKTRRLGELFRMRASYTLQFAQGTGSSAGSSRNAIGAIQGFSAIRNLQYLNFDQRHTLTGNIDFRIPENYFKNPTANKIFKNLGASLTYNIGSGTPFTRNALPNQSDVQGGVNPTTQILGTINGSNLPWAFRFDLRIDKSFLVSLSRKTEEGALKPKNQRMLDINVYLATINLLNTQNVFRVYAFSGLPDDSGFLTSPFAPQFIQSYPEPAAFVDQYRIKEKNPANFSLPRQIRLGVIISF
ncbi:MAG: TonB-dependent receptor [Bacteroidia bacterium]|nr:TonB-dependent receptor [Bacteroidia bacterium]MDW8158393.1 TonB-dependent receptor [Bacteroidia bacterium]